MSNHDYGGSRLLGGGEMRGKVALLLAVGGVVLLWQNGGLHGLLWSMANKANTVAAGEPLVPTAPAPPVAPTSPPETPVAQPPPDAEMGELPGRWRWLVESRFMNQCHLATADAALCECALARFQNTYTERQWVELEMRLTWHPKKVPARVFRVYNRCLLETAPG